MEPQKNVSRETVLYLTPHKIRQSCTPMAAGKKRIRGKRARARQRSRRSGLDVREHLDRRYLPKSKIGFMAVDDPYGQAATLVDGNIDPGARLRQARHADGSIAEGAPCWTPPRRPTVLGAINLRSDPLARMFVRHQIDQSQFDGGRSYQGLLESVVIGGVRGMDWSRPIVDGCGVSELLTERQRKAAIVLKRVDRNVVLKLGIDSLVLLRDVLGEGVAIELAIKRRSLASGDRETRFWAWTFRRALRVVAHSLGFSTTIKQPSRRIDEVPENDNPHPIYFASTNELTNPRYRSGRPG